MAAKKLGTSDLIIGLALTMVTLGLYFGEVSFFEGLEYRLYDLRARLRQESKESREKAAAQNIAIVAIDDASIANIGRWPWPRGVIADLLMAISKAQPKVIGLNILFSEEDRNQGLKEIKELAEKYNLLALSTPKDKRMKMVVEPYLAFGDEFQQAALRLDNDAILEQSIVASSNVVLPMFFVPGPTLGEETGAVSPVLSSNTLTGVQPAGGAWSVQEGRAPTLPLDKFAGAALAVGHVNIQADSDGVMRRESPLLKYRDAYYPSFALQCARAFTGTSLKDLTVVPGARLTVGKTTVPLDRRSGMLLAYLGPAQTFPYFSVFDVLTEKIPPEAFRNKVVLIGHMATGIADLQVTPLGHNYPGVEVAATVVENLLSGRVIWRPAWARTAELAFLALCGAFVTVLLPRLKAKMGAIAAGGLLAVIAGVGTALFVRQGVWLKIYYPASLLLLGYMLVTALRFFFTEKAKALGDAEQIETNKMLGLSFQGQGMLDLAFEKFRKCPIDDTMKDLLYNLALDFERKRQFNKAAAVYEHLGTADENYKDIKAKIELMKGAASGAVMGPIGGKASAGGTVILDANAAQKPTLGRYEILKELGRGAMGVVYLGRDPKINRTVAIKTMKFDDDVPEDQQKAVKERFFREAESAGKLNHPNIIRIFDAGDDYDISYMAMELLDGEDLKGYTEPGKLLPMKEVLEIVATVAEALDYAHKEGVFHRDIKPGNIMKLKDGSLRVADFGIARIADSSKTATGTVLGTPSYMSPEQVAGKKVDGRADLFSLGVMLFEMLTGKKPFEADAIGALLFQICNEPHPDPKSFNPALPDSVVAVINKALVKDADQRYRTGGEMAADLRAAIAQLT